MVNVDICVVIVNHDDLATVGKMLLALHVLLINKVIYIILLLRILLRKYSPMIVMTPTLIIIIWVITIL